MTDGIKKKCERFSRMYVKSVKSYNKKAIMQKKFFCNFVSMLFQSNMFLTTISSEKYIFYILRT